MAVWGCVPIWAPPLHRKDWHRAGFSTPALNPVWRWFASWAGRIIPLQIAPSVKAPGSRFNSCLQVLVGSSDSGLWAQLDDGEKAREGRLSCTKICGKISLHLSRLSFVSIHPCKFRCMEERCRLWGRNFNPACLDQECGNQHQPDLTRFMYSGTGFQQPGLEFGWPHVNTSLAFWGEKKNPGLQAYVCLRFQMMKGGGCINASSAK